MDSRRFRLPFRFARPKELVISVLRLLAWTCVPFGASCAAGPSAADVPSVAVAPEVQAAPRLVVFVVIDQLRADLLFRYEDLFDGGLRRLLDRGRIYTKATHDHAVTETSPGHATLATGTHPSRHGMVSNQWFEQSEGEWKSVLNVDHEAYTLVGDTLLGAGAPERLMRTGLADWLVAAHPEARVVSLAGKSRSAVIMGGQGRNDVFWYDEYFARFTTSTYYRTSIPGWVDRYNEERIPELLADTVWQSLVPRSATARTRADSTSGEGDGVHTFFPHDARSEGYTPPDGYWLANVPALDRAVLGLARVAVEERELGEDEVPDLLALGLSAVDRVGHAYGPRSREQLDNLLRLDRELGSFFDFLDDNLGRDAYLVAVGADHGVMDLPEAPEWNGEARRLTTLDRQDLEKLLGQVVREEASAGPLSLARRLAAEAEQLPWIRAAWPLADLADGLGASASDSFAVLQKNSTYPGRPTGVLGRFGVVYQLAPATLDWNWPLGTHHGSPYYHDRHIPLLIMGPDLEPGSFGDPVSAADLAPTLASWLGIEAPGDLDGRVIPLR